MFVTIVDNRVYVSLSRRNLRQLEAILDRRDTRTMGLWKDENGVSLVVHAEEDSDHYEGTRARAGFAKAASRKR